MHLVTLVRDGHYEPGVLVEGGIASLRDAGFADMHSLIQGGIDSLDRIERWLARGPGDAVLDPITTRLRPPIARPSKIICIGLNYRDHAIESKLPIPEVPTVFAKFATSIIGHRDPIVLPRNSSKPDYEAEFAVVIGRGGRHIRREDWRSHVFGYTILNDVSARDFQMATSQWMIGKTFDTFAPIGPAIATADEIEDPHNLDISLTLNGEIMQSSNTRNLIFGVPELIAYLSSVFTLEPGDIISTGTPAGVGFARTPPRYLKAGDEVAVHVEKIGDLVNPVVMEA